MEMQKRYIRIWNKKNKNAWMVDLDETLDLKGKPEHYISTYYYNEKHKKQFDETKSVAGITDVKTDQIWFDFDSKTDLNLPKNDSIELVDRLEKNGFKPENLEIYYSSNKGFHVIVKLQQELTPKQIQKIVNKFSKNLNTLDHSLYDCNQVLRAPQTLNEETGLYKTQLTKDQLISLDILTIKEMSKSIKANNSALPTKLPEHLFEPDVVEKSDDKLFEELKFSDDLKISELDFTQKPAGWKDYKWALLNGRFKIGERHHSMMVIASTCKALKYDREMTEGLCLAADDKHCKITGDNPIKDLDNILGSVFSESWKGGQYTPENDVFLSEYCEVNGFDLGRNKLLTVSIDDAFNQYKTFVSTASKFRVNTGIKSLDEKSEMTVGKMVGIVASAGTGKTSLALQILNNMSKAGKKAIFFSYDMYMGLVVQKLMQRHTGKNKEQIKELVLNLTEENEKEFKKILNDEYGEIRICFETGQSVKDITKVINDEREKYGDTMNTVIIDYNELIHSNVEDSNGAGSDVMKQLRALANNMGICIIILLQPNKMSGSPKDEQKNYRFIKGSSMSEQSMDLILGLSRPGYDPENPENDKFMVINCSKNRMGELFRLELRWDGYRGIISDDLSYQEKQLLKQLKEEHENPDGLEPYEKGLNQFRQKGSFDEYPYPKR